MASLSEELLVVQLKNQFGGSLDDNLVAECVRICKMYNLSGDDIYYKWEAMRFGLKNTGPITMDGISALKAKCHSDLNKASLAKQKTRVNLKGLLGKTFVGPGRPTAPFGNRVPVKPPVRRQDGFDVVKVEEKSMPVAGPSNVRFIGPGSDPDSKKKRAYRYMYEKKSDRSAALDKRIDDIAELVKEHYDLEELGDPSLTTEEDITVVGRITLDSETSSGPVKLNEASLTLESSRIMGAGARVPLRFDPSTKIRQAKAGQSGIGLFPGAIVALKGRNGGGGWFLVSEILSLPPLKSSPIKPEVDFSFNMLIACGPFTPDTDLQFEPWQKLLAKMKIEKPAVVLLMGPFIDAAHTIIKNGDIDMTPEDMFREQFSIGLGDFLSTSPDSLVLIVPSIRDIVSDHAVFPQCELGLELVNDVRIRLLPNPCRFSLNDVTFAVSSVDVIFHLRKEEFVKKAAEVDSIPAESNEQVGDAVANNCRHLLQQRSFYPIFPVPQELSHEVNLDVTHSQGLDLCGEGTDAEYAPDVMITPSRLKHFAKPVNTTMAINPSFLAKGTYATLTFSGVSEASVGDRIKADIVRLDG